MTSSMMRLCQILVYVVTFFVVADVGNALFGIQFDKKSRTLHLMTGRRNGLTNADANHDHAHAYSKNGGHAYAKTHAHGSFAHAKTLDNKHGSVSALRKTPFLNVKFTHHYRKKRAVIKKLMYG